VNPLVIVTPLSLTSIAMSLLVGAASEPPAAPLLTPVRELLLEHATSPMNAHETRHAVVTRVIEASEHVQWQVTCQGASSRDLREDRNLAQLQL
jgi:hypothetical protein